MSKYNSEYFILKKVEEDAFPNLTPLKDTAGIRFNRRMPEAGQVLKFKNRWREDNIATGIKESIDNVLFNGTDILVDEKIKSILFDCNLHKVGYYPAIYISDNERWLENYNFVTIMNKIDAWSRDLSVYDKDNIGVNGKCYISRIILDSSILDETPYEKRLLFKLDSSMINLTLIHKDLLSKISQEIDDRIAIPLEKYQG